MTAHCLEKIGKEVKTSRFTPLLKRAVVIVTAVLSVTAAHAFTGEQELNQAEALFRASYPGTSRSYKSIAPTKVKGLWRIVAGQNTIYFHEPTKGLFFGKLLARPDGAEFPVTENAIPSPVSGFQAVNLNGKGVYIYPEKGNGKIMLVGEFWVNGEPALFEHETPPPSAPDFEGVLELFEI
ncbi:MAG: disulfide isomerase DsbC N-terminal domain-containing protein [Trichlorobacter sp.]|nr:disulfide isomerase DsbC N-terminal domain-containing protein [Trichlorobacter sp.]